MPAGNQRQIDLVTDAVAEAVAAPMQREAAGLAQAGEIFRRQRDMGLALPVGRSADVPARGYVRAPFPAKPLAGIGDDAVLASARGADDIDQPALPGIG